MKIRLDNSRTAHARAKALIDQGCEVVFPSPYQPAVRTADERRAHKARGGSQ